ncbi:hypothetical protein ACFVZ3_12315 [Kitasatospora purpeofusca]|uniref:hypothetical protein n=1 Tax=Kitasatospora purpeofusca TaxID=67352 RepID=UPI00369E29E9
MTTLPDTAGPTREQRAALPAPTVPADDHDIALAAMLCAPASIAELAAVQGMAVEDLNAAVAGLQERARASGRPHHTARYAACGDLLGDALHGCRSDPCDLHPADRTLLRLRARLTYDEIAAELAVTPATVRRRLDRVHRFLGVTTDHLATAVGGFTGVVRPWDLRPGLRVAAPAVCEELAPAVRVIAAALDGAPHRVSAQIPRTEQSALAAAVARAGARERVLVLAPHGPAWTLALETWGAALRDTGTVAGLLLPGQLTLTRTQAAHRSVVWTARALLNLAGTRQGATVVVTSEALPLITALHRRRGGLRPWDLLVVCDAHRIGRPGGPGQGLYDDRVLPATARLALTSTAPPLLPPAAGSVTVARTAAGAVTGGRVRTHRLLALVPPATGRGGLQGLADLLMATARGHGLRRVLVSCATAVQARHLERALDQAAADLPAPQRPASLWTGTLKPGLTAEQRRQTTTRLADGDEALLVLATCEPVRAPGADALLVLEPDDVHAVAETLEWALEARGRGDAARPLTVLLPLPADSAGPGAAERAAVVARACALLDPSLTTATEQDGPGGPSPWIDTAGHPTPGHLRLLRDVAPLMRGSRT